MRDSLILQLGRLKLKRKMATASTFSYAQAAKGQAAQPNPTATNQPSDAKGTSDPESNSAASSNALVKNADGEEAPIPGDSRAEIALDQEKFSADGEAKSDVVSANTSLSREDDETPTESSTRRSEKSTTRSPSSSTRVTDETEAKKARKGRKGKSNSTTDVEKVKERDEEKEKEKEQPKIELTEAPLPTVNIWTQRKEAQAAKVKPTVVANDSRATPATSDWNAGQDNRRKQKASELTPSKATQNGPAGAVKAQRKDSEETRADSETGAKRGGPRGSRLAGKSDNLPSVADAAIWPTPETAIRDEKRKTNDKPEKPEKVEQAETNEDGSLAKPKKKEQWERIDFVPTVNWETHVPAIRGARGGRGGGSGRGGRDTTSRGGSQAASPPVAPADKPAEPTPATTTAKGPNEQRDKARDGAPATRANPASTATTKQPALDAPRSRENRKAATPSRADRPKDSSAAQTDQLPPRSEGRSERAGRGGPYRGGRGGHAPSSHTLHSQAPYAPNGSPYSSHQGMSARHQQHFTSPPLGQNSSFGQSFGTQGRQSGRGGASRQSPASAGYSHRANGPNANGSRPRPLSTQNISGYSWETYPGVPMTAPPYPPQPYNYEIKSVLTQQVEYYFSVNNLCKDSHLRKHMDSQGFVFLSVIHGFSRVNQLSGGDYPLLRAAVADSVLIDFVSGKDGIDRLRSRAHWQKFVLPVEQRAESAQTAGPEFFFPQSADQQTVSAMAGGGYPMNSPGSYTNGTTFDPSVHANGVALSDNNGQLSAAVPAFQPGALNGQDLSQDSGITQPLAQGVDSSVNGSLDAESQQSGVRES